MANIITQSLLTNISYCFEISSFADGSDGTPCDDDAIFNNDGCSSGENALHAQKMAISKNPNREFANTIFITSVQGDRMLYTVDTDTGL